ncbi:putative CP4-like integrase [Pusillimonas sp. T7-7]|uniref:tyrosine-type recombinase/integrase n=1 Tax=Pusillimonas sp. (strain T7-7) TaxID=1007105 RepID=UPI000208460F|nr:integrase arm-type DNA-binding domain-containing protein [Pusillimonas sp. T7-7]AEC20387.1 putative CP4-like integrase [Pusillimonas sp. T7-7]NYT58727.1 integrase arm-type DNA-binding domain-containing protein [Alcaligenaceae bacterium]
MPKTPKQLTDLAVRKAKPKDAAYTLASGSGLFLRVQPTGIKQWMVRFQTPEGERGSRVIGIYPDMGIADAHKATDELRRRVRMGNTPNGMYDQRRAERFSKTEEDAEADRLAEDARKHSFTVQSDAWLEDRKLGWASATYSKSTFIVRKRLQPLLGSADMRTLASKDVVPVLVDLAISTPSIAIKARQCLNGIIDYCIVRGIRSDDQLLRLQRALPRHRGSHIPAITKIQGVGRLIRTILEYEGRVVRGGLLLAAYTACRPGVVASARWTEMDIERAEWCIPADKMKTRIEHVVSLPRQAVEMLTEMRQYGGGEYVFPGVGKRGNPHLHRDALSKALRDMGFQGQHATHGFRAMLRTVARERLKIDIDVLEAQLAHAKADEVQAAYDRARFEDERRVVMQGWADFLHEQADSAMVLQMKRA